MKRLSIFIALILFGLQSIGQDIVTHGFVNYTTCPSYFSQVNVCTGWRQPTGGTSDYFNACATGTDVGVPHNYFGHQSHIDSAYTGLYTYVENIQDYREYIGTQIVPLIVGNRYTLSITVSLSDSSYYATDGLGVLFTTYEYSSLSYTTINLTPQIEYSSYGTIRDKTNWVTLTSSFVADSAYKYIVVGCFKDDTTQTRDPYQTETANSSEKFSYYYISRIGVPDSTRDTTIHVDTTNQPVIEPVPYTFPNAFSPNGDSHNNTFRIITSNYDKIQDYTLNIYNRWGQLVYTSNDPSNGWDGTFNGQPAEIATYFYYARFKTNNKEQTVKGDLTLVR